MRGLHELASRLMRNGGVEVQPTQQPAFSRQWKDDDRFGAEPPVRSVSIQKAGDQRAGDRYLPVQTGSTSYRDHRAKFRA